MKKIIVNSILVAALSFLSFAFVNAQEQAPAEQSTINSNHEILVQVLVASNEAGKSDLPANLEALARKLKGDLGFTNYRLALTQLSRVSPKAYMQTKGISPLGQNQADAKPLNFYEIAVNFGEVKPDKNGEQNIKIATLNFNISVPIEKRTVNDQGKEASYINYEQLSLRANSIGISFNEPTVIGTLTTSRANEALVLVLTVKPDAAADRQTAKKN